jgi:site-specific DNA-methyltransferase (adenine-specific)
MKKVTIGNATLIHGDCFKVLPKLNEQFDAVISDPPYAISDCDWDYKIPLDAFWNMIECRTKMTASVVLFGAGKFTIDLICSKRRWYRYDLIWQKSKKVGYLNANLQPLRNHESILIFGRPGYQKVSTYCPQKTPGGRVRVQKRNHSSKVYRNKGMYTHKSDGTRHPGSVLQFDSESGLHSTQKPLTLMEFLVKSYSREEETVLDCFMGSGSTAIACIKHNRRFVGIERDKKIGSTCVPGWWVNAVPYQAKLLLNYAKIHKMGDLRLKIGQNGQFVTVFLWYKQSTNPERSKSQKV